MDGTESKELPRERERILAYRNSILGTHYRDEIEENPEYRQLVTYSIIYSPEHDDYALYKRKSGDPRLKETYSLGFGGHVNEHDAKHSHYLQAGQYRELKEELNLSESNLLINAYIGTISMNDTPVNQCHIGFTYLVIPARKARIIPSPEIGELKWRTLDTLIETTYQFDNWSQLLIKYLSQYRTTPIVLPTNSIIEG